jgi:hypothetical protein
MYSLTVDTLLTPSESVYFEDMSMHLAMEMVVQLTNGFESLTSKVCILEPSL